MVVRDHMRVPFYYYVLNAFEGTALAVFVLLMTATVAVAVLVLARTLLAVLLEAQASILTLATALDGTQRVFIADGLVSVFVPVKVAIATAATCGI